MSSSSHLHEPATRETESPEDFSRLGRENALYLSENEKELTSPYPRFGGHKQTNSSGHIPEQLLRNAWKFAALDPLGSRPQGFRNKTATQEFTTALQEFSSADANLSALFQKAFLENRSAEISHVETTEEYNWLLSHLLGNTTSSMKPTEIFACLEKAHGFENFCRLNFPGKRRFSLEGSESINVALETCVRHCKADDTQNLVLAMAHRGRLNIMANLFEIPFKEMLAPFYGLHNEKSYDDVPYHFGAQAHIGEMLCEMLPNPSHLEAVDPVLMGYVRGLLDKESKARGFMIHGNAAFAGQGVVYETLQMALLQSYSIEGCVHLVIDNQVGFTAGPQEGHSADHCAAIGRAFGIPILHVNGDNPEDVAFFADLASNWREQFKKDIILRIVTFRRLGHNETDDASFTDPKMAQAIAAHEPVSEIYAQSIIKNNIASEDEVLKIKNSIKDGFKKQHEECLELQKKASSSAKNTDKEAAGLSPMTGIPDTRIKDIFQTASIENLYEALPNFALHPKLESFFSKRSTMFTNPADKLLDWGTAEALAFTSLALDGHPIRLAGQDSERGTFSHRHANIHCQETGKKWDWMNELSQRQAEIQVINSPLSEYAALNFEYGYSLARPEGLTLWEAQFGDFVNGAQIAIDQFLFSGEAKWGRKTTLTLLLPHGFEGAGPEHSSGRMERFLQLAADDNCRVLCLSNAANYFHALRGQILRNDKKPCVIFTPKSLLRLASSFSSLNEVGAQTRFLPITEGHQGSKAKTVIFCSGKIAYDLEEALSNVPKAAEEIAVFHLEQLFPFPEQEVSEVLNNGSSKKVIWLQEEPANMGALSFVAPYFNEITKTFETISRPASASPATGDASNHAAQQKALFEQILKSIG